VTYADPGEPEWRRAVLRCMGSEQALVRKIQEARRRLATDGPPHVRSDGDFARVSLPVEDSDVLRDVLLAENPGTVIEIGLAYGSSALAIAEALVAAGSDEARHVIVDAYQNRFHGSGWAAITGAGLAGLCSLVEERSHIALPRSAGRWLGRRRRVRGRKPYLSQRICRLVLPTRAGPPGRAGDP